MKHAIQHRLLIHGLLSELFLERFLESMQLGSMAGNCCFKMGTLLLHLVTNLMKLLVVVSRMLGHGFLQALGMLLQLMHLFFKVINPGIMSPFTVNIHAGTRELRQHC